MYSIRPWSIAWATLVLVALGWGAEAAQAQDASARLAYFRAVGDYFDLPASEVSILADWELRPDEIPVALFVASRAGISPEALVALRSSGRSWSELARRYQVSASQLHVPFARPPSAGPLAAAYEQYGGRPVGEWSRIELSDEEIVTLVNVRVLSETLRMPPDTILQRRTSARSFVEVYAQLIR